MAAKTEELLAQAEKASDASINHAERAFPNAEESRSFFDHVKRKMLDISEWSKVSTPSEYALFNETGKEINDQPAEVGTFIRINLLASGKYDWVEVGHIHETPNEFVITVKPAFDPTEQPQQPEVISHFFQPTAVNNFCLWRDGEMLRFNIIGFNERQNTDFTSGIIETARNIAAANVGHYLGIQKAAWTEFAKNMLELDEE